MSVSELLAALPQAARSPQAPVPAPAGEAGRRLDATTHAASGPHSPFRRFLHELRRAKPDRTEIPRPSDAVRDSAGTNDPTPAGRDDSAARAEDSQAPRATDSARRTRTGSARPDPTDAPRGSGAEGGTESPRGIAETDGDAENGAIDTAGPEDVVSRIADAAPPVSSTEATGAAPPVEESVEPVDSELDELPPGLRELLAQLAEAVHSGPDGDDVPVLPDDASGPDSGQAPPGLVALWNRWAATGSIAGSGSDDCGATVPCASDDVASNLGDVAGTGDGSGAPTILDVLATVDPAAASTETGGDGAKDVAGDANDEGVSSADVLAIVPPVANAVPAEVAPAVTVVASDPRVKSKSELRTDRTVHAGSPQDGQVDSSVLASHGSTGPLDSNSQDATTTGPAAATDDLPEGDPAAIDGPATEVDGTAPRSSIAAASGPAHGTGPAAGARSADGELTVPPHIDPNRFADRLARFVGEAHVGDRTLRVRLEPPELGALRIEVSLRDGALSARLDVQTEAARRTLAEHLPLLHEALARLGTALERVDVQREATGERSFADDRNSAGRDGFGSLAGFGGSDGQAGGNESSRTPFAAGAPEPEQPTTGPPRTNRPGRDLSGLDIRV